MFLEEIVSIRDQSNESSLIVPKISGVRDQASAKDDAVSDQGFPPGSHGTPGRHHVSGKKEKNFLSLYKNHSISRAHSMIPSVKTMTEEAVGWQHTITAR